MRRITIDSTISEVGKFLGIESAIEKVESLEIVSLLREDPKEWAMICRVRMKEASVNFEKAIGTELAIVQHLEKEKNGDDIFFVRRKPIPLAANVFSTGGYLSLPIEIQAGRIRASYVGNSQQVKRFLNIIRKTGIECKILSISDAKFPAASPLAILTDKQRKVIINAFHFGYYDIPKKISNAEIAEKMHIRGPTFVRHREKAERKVIAALLSKV